jgi:hypothetical protein
MSALVTTITLTDNATITVIRDTITIDENNKLTTITAGKDGGVTVDARDTSWFRFIQPIDYQFVPAASVYCYSFSLAGMWKYRNGRRCRRHLLHKVDWYCLDNADCFICKQQIVQDAVCCPKCWRNNSAELPFRGYIHLACWQNQRKPPGSFDVAMVLAMKNGQDTTRDCKMCGLCLKQR